MATRVGGDSGGSALWELIGSQQGQSKLRISFQQETLHALNLVSVPVQNKTSSFLYLEQKNLSKLLHVRSKNLL